MSNKEETTPQQQKQQPGQQDTTGSGKNPDTKTKPYQEAQKQPDTSKKGPLQDNNSQHKDHPGQKQAV
jgi:hypothetical protein